MEQASVFIVEDELIEAEDIRTTLIQMGYAVAGNARTGEAALRALETAAPDIVLMDIFLEGEMDGIETAGLIRDRFRVPVIFLTAHADDASLRRAKMTEPYGYIIKPFDEQDLRSSIELALYKHRLERLAEEQTRIISILADAVADPLVLLDERRQIIAQNEAMMVLLGTNRQNATTDATALFSHSPCCGALRTRVDEAARTGRNLKFEETDGTEWYEIAINPVPGTGKGPDAPWVLIHYHNITRRREIEEDLRSKGVARLERNMEQFQILNDQIRNPLQAIMGYVTLDCAGFRDRILDQVRVIDSLVHQLDQGWVESEKVRQFLLRHYHEGEQDGDRKETS